VSSSEASSPPVAAQTPGSRLGFRIETRDAAGSASTGHRVVAIALGFGAIAAFVALHADSGTLFRTAWASTLGSPLGVTQVIQLSTPLIIAGAAAAIVQRMRMWNLGIQGQLVAGAWMATLLAFALPDLHGAVLVPLLLLGGLVGGAVWMVIPALARTYLNVNEVITTLMFSFVGELWLAYWATGPWADEGMGASGALFSRPISDNTRMPQFSFGSVVISLGFFIAVGVALALWAFFRYTHFGYRATITAAGEKTATYAGVKFRRVRLAMMLFSGAVGGLAGAVLLLDQIHTFSSPLTAGNTGYIAIVVALLAANVFSAIVITGLLVGFIVASGNALQIGGFSGNVVFLLTGLLLLLAACAEAAARYRVRRAVSGGPAEEPVR
jgi:simple sugar transport system permease protein